MGRISLVLGAGLLALAGLTVLLSMRVVALGDALDEAERRAILPRSGQYVPQFSTRTLTGDSIVVGRPAGSFQLLAVFNTTCGFCEHTLPVWQRLDSVSRHRIDVQMLGWSRHDSARTAKYALSHSLPYPVFAEESPRWANTFRVMAVPATLVLDSSGRILFARSGVLTASGLDSLIAVFP